MSSSSMVQEDGPVALFSIFFVSVDTQISWQADQLCVRRISSSILEDRVRMNLDHSALCFVTNSLILSVIFTILPAVRKSS